MTRSRDNYLENRRYAAYAACFAEKYIPYGKSLSDESRDEIRKVICRLKAQKSPVFSREHLMDDMGL